MFDIRYSKPYYEKEEKLWAIIPLKVNEKNVQSISINFSSVDYLYLTKNVERVIIEKKSVFNTINIEEDNNYLTIYKNSLLYKPTQIFINDGVNTFNKEGMNNQKDFQSDYRLLNRKRLDFKKIVDVRIEFASDLQ